MEKTNDTYLGDGVYASFDGHHIVLDLRAQSASTIALEPEVMNALIGYANKVWKTNLTGFLRETE